MNNFRQEISTVLFTRSSLGAAGTDIHHSFNQQIVESDRLRVAASRRISFSGFLLEEMQNQNEAKERVLLIFAIKCHGLPLTGTRYLRLLSLYKLPYVCET